MARPLQEISLSHLSKSIREAREKKGWTLERLSRELWMLGYPTSQNKLWRLEQKPPKRIDTELLLWLEKVLDVELLESEDQKQVLIEDVAALIDQFLKGTEPGESAPDRPENRALWEIHEKLTALTFFDPEEGNSETAPVE